MYFNDVPTVGLPSADLAAVQTHRRQKAARQSMR